MIKDLSLILVSILLSSLVTIFFLIKEPPSIVVVDDELLYKDFIIAISKSIESSEEKEVEEKVEIYKVAVKEFNDKIDQIAKEKNIVVFNKKAVMGGSEDQTGQAQELLKGLMEEVSHDKK